MNQIAENLRAVTERIAAACERAGRPASEVRLLPMSKLQPVAAIRDALEAGFTRFGENTVQELVAKAHELSDTPAEFAITGHLQTNKANKVVDLATEFQALDSLRLAQELDRRCRTAGRRLPVLVQVNSSGEESKHGFAPEEVDAFARELVGMAGLEVRGLMTLALPSSDPEPVAACFERMREVQRRLQDADLPGLAWDELSMGMTDDFELAIEHGATCVRVGRAIFGARDYG